MVSGWRVADLSPTVNLHARYYGKDGEKTSISPEESVECGIAFVLNVLCMSPGSLQPQGDEIERASPWDAEGKMRDPCALDHPCALQVDRPGP
jgi:hypothetical protein